LTPEESPPPVQLARAAESQGLVELEIAEQPRATAIITRMKSGGASS